MRLETDMENLPGPKGTSRTRTSTLMLYQLTSSWSRKQQKHVIFPAPYTPRLSPKTCGSTTGTITTWLSWISFWSQPNSGPGSGRYEGTRGPVKTSGLVSVLRTVRYEQSVSQSGSPLQPHSHFLKTVHLLFPPDFLIHLLTCSHFPHQPITTSTSPDPSFLCQFILVSMCFKQPESDYDSTALPVPACELMYVF